MNEYNINVDFTKGRISTNLRKLVQNDYNTTKLNFTFDKEGRVLFKMLYPDGTQYVDEIQNNELVFGKGVLNQEGIYEYEISLYSEDGRLTDYAVKSFEVRSELVDTDEIVEPDDRVPVLDTLINEVSTIKQDVEDGKYNGEDGKNGITPTIGENGNWYIGDIDTGLPSRGEPGKAGSVKFIVANELPSENIEEDAIYMIPEENPDSPTNTKNTYQEYIYVNGAWESLGSASVEVDLSNYPTKEEMESAINEIAGSSGGGDTNYTIHIDYETWGSSDFRKSYFQNVINDMKNGKKPIIFTKYNNATQASTYGSDIYVAPTITNDLNTYSGTLYFKTMKESRCISGSSMGKPALIYAYFTQKISVTVNNGTVTDVTTPTENSNVQNAVVNNLLTMTNLTAYDVTGDYHPAHKKYVDDAVANAGGGACPVYNFDFSQYISKMTSKQSFRSTNTNDLNRASEIINDMNSNSFNAAIINVHSTSSSAYNSDANMCISQFGSVSNKSTYFSFMGINKIEHLYGDSYDFANYKMIIEGTWTNEVFSASKVTVETRLLRFDSGIASVNYVDTAITNAITTTLEGEY